MSKIEQFSTITNIKIIVDNKTGFYNITKINNYIYDQICKQNEAPAIAGASKKKDMYDN
jgi:NAD(P)H-flavin reductase